MEQYNANRATISFHLTQEEKEQIVNEADQNSQTITDYLKELVFTKNQSDEISNLLKVYEIDDLEEVLVGWTALMDDEAVSETFERYKGRSITVTTIYGKNEYEIESKLDIILVKLWMIPNKAH